LASGQYRLVKHSAIRAAQFFAFLREWERRGERMVPYVIDRKGRSFRQLAAQWAFDETEAVREKGFVPATLYFLVGRGGRIVGVLHFRHELNAKLRRHGGHIGYGIRPSERGKGYAALMLGMFLKRPRVRKLGRVLITCDDDNIPSYRTIERCGGRLWDKVRVEGNLSRRYWVATGKHRRAGPPGRPSAGKEHGSMNAKRKIGNDVDRYIAQFPKDVQIPLQKVRRTIRAAAPGAEETIKYRMPTFVLGGNLIHFAAFDKHIGLYPTPSGIARFRRELARHPTSKGAIQFPLGKPVPYGLIARITKFRVQENRERAERKKK
jgi:predicted acetyltransferase/uncharacterized protein YdhG (YjbR/CyaY superfamily)